MYTSNPANRSLTESRKSWVQELSSRTRVLHPTPLQELLQTTKQRTDPWDLALGGTVLCASSSAPPDGADQRNLKESHSQISATTFNLRGVGRLIGCLTPRLSHFLKFPEAFTSHNLSRRGIVHLPQPNHSPEQFFVLDFTGSEWSRGGLPSLIHSHNFLKQRFKTCLNQLDRGYQNTQTTGQNQGETHITFT